MSRVLIASTRDHPTAFDADLPLVMALDQLGVESQIVDWRETRDLRANRIFVRSTWDYTRHISEFRTWYKDESARILNSYACFEWNYHKRYLLELASAGISIVPTILFKAHEQDYRKASGAYLFRSSADRFCIKPAISAGSDRTFLIGANEVESCLSQYAVGEDVLLQPFLETVGQDGEMSLIWVNDALGMSEAACTHAIVKRPRSGDFRVQPQFGGEVEAVAARPEHLALCKKVLALVPGQWLVARVDLLDWQNDSLVAEIEMIEPNLFYEKNSRAAAVLARAIAASL